MNAWKVLAGLVVLAALAGLVYEFRRAGELELELAQVRTERATSGRQLQEIQQQVAELKQRAAASAPSARAAAPATPGAAATAPIAASAPAPQPGVTPKAPPGWNKNGSANDLYEVGVDENNAWGGMPSAYAKSTGAADGKFGGMMQTIAADTYAGQRVRLTGWMKTEDANDGGGHLWMRIDGAGSGNTLQFDNMNGRAPKGTTDWQEYSVVLDVPPESKRVNYGFFVEGSGKMWVNGVTITPVGSEVPTTNLLAAGGNLPKTPVNLGFTPPKK